MYKDIQQLKISVGSNFKKLSSQIITQCHHTEQQSSTSLPGIVASTQQTMNVTN